MVNWRHVAGVAAGIATCVMHLRHVAGIAESKKSQEHKAYKLGEESTLEPSFLEGIRLIFSLILAFFPTHNGLSGV